MDQRHPARHRSDVTLHLVPSAGIQPAPDGRRPLKTSLRRYPFWRVLGIDVYTAAHFVLGCAAILVAWRGQPLVAWPVGLAYLVFAAVQSLCSRRWSSARAASTARWPAAAARAV